MGHEESGQNKFATWGTLGRVGNDRNEMRNSARERNFRSANTGIGLREHDYSLSFSGGPTGKRGQCDGWEIRLM